MCNICKIKNTELQNKIEEALDKNSGNLTINDKKALILEFPDFEEVIDNLTDDECNKHWNFHQSINYVERQEETPSLAKDINKSEAEILYDLINKQAATFNCLTNKINKELTSEELVCSIVNPNIVEFYRDLTASIRATAKELRELNVTINGSKDGASEGLKALAEALKPQNKNEEEKDLTTDMYDNVEAI